MRETSFHHCHYQQKKNKNEKGIPQANPYPRHCAHLTLRRVHFFCFWRDGFPIFYTSKIYFLRFVLGPWVTSELQSAAQISFISEGLVSEATTRRMQNIYSDQYGLPSNWANNWFSRTHRGGTLHHFLLA